MIRNLKKICGCLFLVGIPFVLYHLLSIQSIWIFVIFAGGYAIGWCIAKNELSWINLQNLFVETKRKQTLTALTSTLSLYVILAFALRYNFRDILEITGVNTIWTATEYFIRIVICLILPFYQGMVFRRWLIGNSRGYTAIILIIISAFLCSFVPGGNIITFIESIIVYAYLAYVYVRTKDSLLHIVLQIFYGLLYVIWT